MNRTPELPDPATPETDDLATAARAAAAALDLEARRRLIYVGEDGTVLAAFLDRWPQLAGLWFGPTEGIGAAEVFLRSRRLEHRMAYLAGERLAATAAAELVLLNAADAAVDRSLELLVSAGAGWLPAGGRWLILVREAPHLSCIVGTSLLQAQGLRLAARRPLAPGLALLDCEPARAGRAVASCAAR